MDKHSCYADELLQLKVSDLFQPLSQIVNAALSCALTKRNDALGFRKERLTLAFKTNDVMISVTRSSVMEVVSP